MEQDAMPPRLRRSDELVAEFGEPKSMTIEIVVDQIKVLPRLRALNDEQVGALAASMSQLGLQTPVTVRFVTEEGNASAVPTLVAGAHRLEAYKRLGMKTIEALVIEGDDDDVRLWEIDENLCRAELTEIERGEHLVARKEVWERVEASKDRVGQPVPPEIGYKKPPRPKRSFAADTAAKTGLSKRTINRSIKRKNEVTDEALDLIRLTKFDNGAFLDRLAKEKPGNQVAFVQACFANPKANEDGEAIQPIDKVLKREAKEAKKRSVADVLEFFHENLSTEKLAELIEMIDRAGGMVTSAVERLQRAKGRARLVRRLVDPPAALILRFLQSGPDLTPSPVRRPDGAINFGRSSRLICAGAKR